MTRASLSPAPSRRPASAPGATGAGTTVVGAALLALVTALYLVLGLIFGAGALFFPAALAGYHGHAQVANDWTQLIHLAAGLSALALALVGLAALRLWLCRRHYPRLFAAAVALTSFSCMFGLMPTNEQNPVTALGITLMALSMLAFFVVLGRLGEHGIEETADVNPDAGN